MRPRVAAELAAAAEAVQEPVVVARLAPRVPLRLPVAVAPLRAQEPQVFLPVELRAGLLLWLHHRPRRVVEERRAAVVAEAVVAVAEAVPLPLPVVAVRRFPASKS
jgi:hypothetical protein